LLVSRRVFGARFGAGPPPWRGSSQRRSVAAMPVEAKRLAACRCAGESAVARASEGIGTKASTSHRERRLANKRAAGDASAVVPRSGNALVHAPNRHRSMGLP
ncbi:hypothetical protein AB4084_05845, partial [Lysobacter sp. 2RAB21]